MSETTEIKKSKTSELPEQTSPSTSATLVGVDNGETVQIPIDKFAVIDTDETIPERKILTGDYNITGGLFPKEGVILEDGRGITLYGQYDRGHTYVDLHSNEDCKIEYTAKADDDTYTHDFLATESFVEEKVAGIVNSAPAALDTLNELSKALGDNPTFAADIVNLIGNKVDKTVQVNGQPLSTSVVISKYHVGLGNVVNTGDSATPVSGGTTKFTTGGAYTELAKKVDKVSGKGLSTNDYTTAEKNKLAGLSTVASSGSYNDLKDKPTIPSIAGLATEKYVDEKINSLPSGGGSSSGGGGGIIDVTELPTENTSAIYRVEEIEAAKMLNVVGNEDGSFTISIIEGADVYIVDTLPEVGVPMMDMTTGKQTFYMTKDQQCYMYLDELIAEELGAPSAGWFSFADIGAITVIVNSIDEITNPDTSGQTMYVLVVKQQRLYYHNGREFVKLSNTTDDLSIPIPVANETTVGGLKYSFDESTATLTLIFD